MMGDQKKYNLYCSVPGEGSEVCAMPPSIISITLGDTDTVGPGLGRVGRDGGDSATHYSEKKLALPCDQDDFIPTATPTPPDTVSSSSRDIVITGDQFRYGWYRFTPERLQFLNKPQFLLFFMSLSVIAQGMIVNGFVATAISTIEKRFDLNSKQTGLIAGMYDAAVVLVLFIVCHYGGHGHKGKWIGFGMVILGIGAFMFSLPQMLVDKYEFEPDNKTLALCDVSSTSDSSFASAFIEHCKQSYLTNYIFFFILAQILHGIGASPLFTLGVTYIDENVSQKMCPIYLGLYYAVGVIGPALGYIVGGVFLTIYGDVGKVPPGYAMLIT